ncbi:MAG: hypothetical protein ACRC9E_07240, partial [Plesiomonas shigelloides]
MLFLLFLLFPLVALIALLWAFAFIPRLFKIFAFHAERIVLMQEMSRVMAITKFCQLLRCG